MAKRTSTSTSSFPALAWLAKPDEFPLNPVCAVFGDESFLRREILHALRTRVMGADAEQDFSYTSFDGSTVTWSGVVEELSTFSMFGPQQRLVVVTGADDFVSKNKDILEAYIPQPVSTGILVLEMNTCASNTRVYKLLEEHGTLVDCRTPGDAEITAWIQIRARNHHGFQIAPDATRTLLEQVGGEMGLLDQELQKLSLTADKEKPVQAADIRKLSGSWRQQQAWDLVDYVLDGKSPEAMQCLERLLAAGEAPIMLVAAMSASLRRLATATRLILSAEKEGRKLSVDEALKTAGVNPYFLQKTRSQLQRLGRHRGEMLLPLLVELDFDLKGDSPLDARLLMERFILRLAAPMKK